MNKYVKMMYIILGLAFLFFVSPTLASTTCDGMDIFGMKCCIEKGATVPEGLQTHTDTLYSIQSGTIYQSTTSGNVEMDSGAKNFRYFQMLFERRSYTSLNFFEDMYLGTTKYTVALGQKCNHPEIRINGKEYRNNMGIFNVKSDNQYLRLYYYEYGTLNAMRCMPKAVTSDEYKVSSTGNIITNTGNVESGQSSLDPRPTTLAPIILENIKTYQQLNQSTLYELVKQWGMDWKTERNSLAEQAGIAPGTYKGTKTQNLIIRDYLLKKISINSKATTTPDIMLSAERFEKVQTTALWQIVGLRNYTWKNQRVNIAKEYGYQPQIYVGTRAQNIKIRSRLLNKIHKGE